MVFKLSATPFSLLRSNYFSYVILLFIRAHSCAFVFTNDFVFLCVLRVLCVLVVNAFSYFSSVVLCSIVQSPARDR